MRTRTIWMAIVMTSTVIACAASAQDGSTQGTRTWEARGDRGAIVAGCREGADAGRAMLQAGGNAIDAMVSSILVQTVVESSLACFGGELPILVYDAKRGVVEVVVGLGAAPQLATPEWFREHRKGVIQGRGDVANAVVPGVLDACLVALERYGSRTFGECAAPMRAILETRDAETADGLQAPQRGRRPPPTAEQLQQQIDHSRNFLQMIARLIEAEQAAGPDRLRGLRSVRDTFYRGPIARELDAWSRANGGLLRFSDLANHVTRIDEPVSLEFAGHTVYKCGVWSQGPFMLQTLRLLEGNNLAELGQNSTPYVHTVVEAMKLAFADRDAFYGDPAFVEVPLERLLSDEYTALRRALVDPATASQVQQPGDPFKMKPLLGVAPQDHQVTSGFSSDTSNCLVADQWGNVVAATPSGWGGVIAGNTGIELGSRMIGLNCWEGHPSIVAPGKRPRITLTPTLVMKHRKPVLAISVAGGDQQDQASLQVFLNRAVFGMEPAAAVRAPRFSTRHHIDWFGHLPAHPGSLLLPPSFDETSVRALQALGHETSTSRTAGIAVSLVIDPASGQKIAVGDNGRHAAAH